MPIQVPVLLGPGRGHRFDANGVRGSADALLGRYERPVASFLLEAFRSGKTFADIGAHTGYFTRLAMRTLPPGGRVVAFEPDRESRERLLETADPTTVAVRSEALGAEDAEGTLVVNPGKCSRLNYTSPDGPGSRESVQIRSLDSLVADGTVPQPDIVKIDVEGAEVTVLTGATTVLASTQSLVVECHSVPLFHEVLGIVLDAGFKTVRTTEGGDHLGPPTVLALRAG